MKTINRFIVVSLCVVLGSATLMAEEKKTEKKGKTMEANTSTSAEKDFKTTSTGLKYKVIKKGTGAHPKATDTVRVHYKGTLTNGTEFDSSYKRGTPAEFPLNQVIKGWTEGLQIMEEGATYQFVIPPELAYGNRALPGIPANSTLTFDVELIKIVK